MSKITEENILELLEEIDDSIDYMDEEALIDDHMLDSFAIITLVAEIGDQFGVKIGASELVPENFNTVAAITELVNRLSESMS